MAERPAAINPRLLAPQQQAIVVPRARLQMANSGTLLISIAWSAILMHCCASPSSGEDEEEPFPAAGGRACALVAFLLFLVGVSLVLLALVADRFPRAAVVGVAIARALRLYLLGLGWRE